MILGTVVAAADPPAKKDWDWVFNAPPISPETAAFVEGGNLRNIEFHMFYDLLCSDCAAVNPEF